MKFKITRTSEWDDNQPCEGAVFESYLKSFQVHDEKYWRQGGVNHRIEDGKWFRDDPCIGWHIEINSLEELLELARKVETELIVDAENMELEIYDGYRE